MDPVTPSRTRGFDVAPCYRVRVVDKNVASGTRDEILYTVSGTSILDPNNTIRMSGLVNIQAPQDVDCDACSTDEAGLLFYAPEFGALAWRLWLPVHIQTEECA